MYGIRVALRVWFLCNLCFMGLVAQGLLGLGAGPDFLQRTWVILGVAMPWIFGIGMNLMAASLFFVSKSSSWTHPQWLWWANEGLFCVILIHNFILA